MWPPGWSSRLIFERLAYTRLVLKKLSGAVDKAADVIREIQGPPISSERGQLNIGLTKNTTTLVRHSRSCGALRIIRHIKLYAAGSESLSVRPAQPIPSYFLLTSSFRKIPHFSLCLSLFLFLSLFLYPRAREDNETQRTSGGRRFATQK